MKVHLSTHISLIWELVGISNVFEWYRIGHDTHDALPKCDIECLSFSCWKLFQFPILSLTIKIAKLFPNWWELRCSGVGLCWNACWMCTTELRYLQLLYPSKNWSNDFRKSFTRPRHQHRCYVHSYERQMHVWPACIHESEPFAFIAIAFCNWLSCLLRFVLNAHTFFPFSSIKSRAESWDSDENFK